MPHAPCRGCDKRHTGCHASCEDYQEFRKFRDEILVKRQNDNQAMPDMNKKAMKSMYKNMRK